VPLSQALDPRWQRQPRTTRPACVSLRRGLVGSCRVIVSSDQNGVHAIVRGYSVLGCGEDLQTDG